MTDRPTTKMRWQCIPHELKILQDWLVLEDCAVKVSSLLETPMQLVVRGLPSLPIEKSRRY